MTAPHGTALIVDDEESIRYALVREMEKLGFDSSAASSAQEALDVAGGKSFDLIMLDVRMPGMTGLDALAKLRSMLPGACIIMLTAVVDTEIAARTLRLGADDYLTKPWGSEDLRWRIERATDRRRKRGEGASVEEDRREEVHEASITADLISQQMTAYERMLARGDVQPQKRSRRGWWPWRRKG